MFNGLQTEMTKFQRKWVKHSYVEILLLIQFIRRIFEYLYVPSQKKNTKMVTRLYVKMFILIRPSHVGSNLGLYRA